MAVMARAFKGIDRTKNQDWAKAVGQAVLNFSAIELLSYLWIESLCGDAIAKRYLKRLRPLSDRIDEILAAVRQHHGKDPWGAQAIEVWDEVRKAAQLRNRIAHNPTVIVNRDGTETLELIHVVTYDERTGKSKTTSNSKLISGLAKAFAQTATELNDLLGKRP